MNAASPGAERLRRLVFQATCALLVFGAGLGVLQSLRFDGGLPPVELGYSWYLSELEERGQDERVLAELATAALVDVGWRQVAHNKIGVRLLARGDAPGAEARFRAALAITPDYPLAHANLAGAPRAPRAQRRGDRAPRARARAPAALAQGAAQPATPARGRLDPME